MKQIAALIVGCSCIFGGLLLWYIAHKNQSQPGGSSRTFWGAVFSGNMLLLWGLSTLVAHELLPGGKSVDSLLSIGGAASLLAYLHTIRPPSPTVKASDTPDTNDTPGPLRVPNR